MSYSNILVCGCFVTLWRISYVPFGRLTKKQTMYSAHRNLDDIPMEVFSEMYRESGKWEQLRKYLLEESSQGKREFRISMQSDTSFLIHPLGEDGAAMDFEF
jgi:hypothetical protein